jgi:hypothetical protein
LLIEVEHGLLDGAHRPRTHSRSTVQDPIHGRQTQPRLGGDVGVPMGTVRHTPEYGDHDGSLRGF